MAESKYLNDRQTLALEEQKKREDEQRLKQKDNYDNVVQNGGYNIDDNMLRRMSAYNYGAAQGQKEFYNDADIQALRKRREDLSQGYSGQELGALRAEARNQIAGQRQNYLSQLKGNLARSGVGGARAAAVQDAASQKYAGQGADAERKLALDSAQMKRQGVGDLQDFLFRQKLGKLGLAYGQQALSSSDYAAERAAKANSGGGKK